MTNQALRRQLDQNETESAVEIETERSMLKPLDAFRFSDIKALPVRWLWKPFLALGTFNLLEGEEGIGKTFLVCALASAIGSGRGLPAVPEDEHIEPSNVILISAEDSLSYVLKPRLESMNAPCDRIIAVEEPFSLDANGIFRLSLTLEQFRPKFVVMDPLFSYTGRMNLDRDNDIRAITDQLKRLAEKYDCCILGIRHVGKSKGFGDARNAGLNGVGWRASARSALLIGKNPEREHEKALCQTKNNLAPKFEKSLGFEIRDAQFFWTGESSLTAETMLSSLRNETGDEKAERNEAVAFLREILNSGEREAKEVEKEADKSFGITIKQLRTARNKLDVQWRREGFGKESKIFWRLPHIDAHKNTIDDRINETGHILVNDSDKTNYSNDLHIDAPFPNNGHLWNGKKPVCSKCGLEMETTKDETELFCTFGCGSRKAES